MFQGIVQKKLNKQDIKVKLARTKWFDFLNLEQGVKNSLFPWIVSGQKKHVL